MLKAVITNVKPVEVSVEELPVETARLMHILAEALHNAGYMLNSDLADLSSVAEYIQMNPANYTVFDWIRDTRENYPEYLIEL